MGRLFENLFVLFVGLKLAGFISWSWWWITSPLWIPLLLIILADKSNN